MQSAENPSENPSKDELKDDEAQPTPKEVAEEKSSGEASQPDYAAQGAKLRMELETKNFVIKKLEAKIQDYETKIAEIRDYVKRMEDEIVQIRVRSERDLQKTLDQKRSSFFTALLPIVDNFERSLSSASSDTSPMAEGIRLIYKDFSAFLDQENLKRIPSLDQEFNPTYHEAIVGQPVEDSAKVGKVVQEFKAGYTYKDMVVRPAQVAVGQATIEQ